MTSRDFAFVITLLYPPLTPDRQFLATVGSGEFDLADISFSRRLMLRNLSSSIPLPSSMPAPRQKPRCLFFGYRARAARNWSGRALSMSDQKPPKSCENAPSALSDALNIAWNRELSPLRLSCIR